MLKDQNFELGRKAYDQGNKESAVSYFAAFVREFPHSEAGWLWLGHSLDDVEKRRYCYERVLQMNSSNSEAKVGLTSLQPKPSINPSITPEEKSTDAGILVEKKETASSIPAPKSFLRPVLLGIIGFLGGVICVGLPLLYYHPSTSYNFLMPLFFPNGYSPVTVEAGDPSFPELPDGIPTDKPQDTASLILEAKTFIASEAYAKAIQVLDQAIDQDPNSHEAYFLRALSYNKLTDDQRYFNEAWDYIILGLNDIDAAISLEPANGDYYMMRHDLLTNLSGMTELQADTASLNLLAAENALMAMNLGTSLNEYPDREYVINLISGERCEEAYLLTEDMIRKTPKGDIHITGLYHIQSSALSCLGRLDEAIEMVTRSMENPKNMEYKKRLLAIYLLQADRNEDALKIINELIEAQPAYSGDRYYLRAVIHYTLGNKELAEKDLYTGAQNVWSQAGLYSYVAGKIALDEGNIEDGIALLQNAEATLDVTFNPFRKKIRNELEELGASPLDLSSFPVWPATPITQITPFPTPGP